MDFNEILQLAKEFLSCPVCNERFESEKIHFRGFIDDKFIIQTECSRGHQPINALFISNISLTGKHTPSNEIPFTSNQVLDLKLALNTFDGNFERVFTKDRLHGKDNSQSQNTDPQGQAG